MTNQNDKQKLLLEYLISSPETFTLCRSLIQPEYFDPEFRRAVEFIIKYYDQYSATPSPEQISAEGSIALKTHQVTKDQIKYCCTEIESFCQKQALIKAILASPELIEDGNIEKVQSLIKDAVSLSLQRDIGLDYFADPLSRLERLSQTPPRTPTKWKDLDILFGGGLARTEILLVCANSGVGKSITLSNLGINFLEQNCRVLYISLELSQDLVGQRLDMMFSEIPSMLVQTKYLDIAEKVIEASRYLDHLTIKWMPSGTNSNQIRSYLKEYELTYNCIPDLLIVDYLDLMGTNEKAPAGIWEKDKAATEQLSDIGKEYNLFIATASQLNRSAIEAEELNQSHTAGGLSKVNTVDWQLAITCTPAMKAAGEIMYTFLKARSSDAVGKTATLKWNSSNLRISNFPDKDDEEDMRKAIENRKSFKGLPDKSNKTLLEIMDI